LCAIGACIAGSGAVAHAEEPLSPDDLARKNTGGYFTGLPLFAYSTDIGLGLGARAYYYFNGDRDDPRFPTTPYLQRIFLQVFVSTRGVQFHWLDYDAPHVFDSPYRIRSQLIYQRNTNENYFGRGDAALQPLQYTGSPQYAHYSDYVAAQQHVVNGTTYSKFDQYDLLRPIFIASIERLFLHDRVRVLGGVGFSYARVDQYDGKSVDAVDDAGSQVKAIENQTRLAIDCAAQRIVGCDGGRDDYLRFGVSYDTRDFEPDPNTGIYLDAALDLGTALLASQYDYARFMLAARGYYSPFPDVADLVLAARGVLQVQSAGTPFFSMDTIPFTEDPRNGLGGHRTLRGYRDDRFVGPTMTLFNAEIRWTFTKFKLFKQKFGLILAPFFDYGRPYDHFTELSYKDWKYSVGSALRISWNLSTIITMDYGVSPEDTGFYINFNHIF
jgi:hypothetical protein